MLITDSFYEHLSAVISTIFL